MLGEKCAAHDPGGRAHRIAQPLRMRRCGCSPPTNSVEWHPQHVSGGRHAVPPGFRPIAISTCRGCRPSCSPRAPRASCATECPMSRDGPRVRGGSPRPGVQMGIPRRGRLGRRAVSFRARTTGSIRWPRPASTTRASAASAALATRICASRKWRRTASTPRSSSASWASPRGSRITRRRTRCCASTTTGCAIFLASHYPDRQIGLACLPYGDIDAAVKEIHRVAKLGLKGLELSCSWDMEPMWHPVWEPLWKAVNDVQLPLHFHNLPRRPPPQRARTGPRNRRRRARPVHRRRRVPDEPDQHQSPRSSAPASWSAIRNLRVGFWRILASAGSPTPLDRMDFEFEDRFPRPDEG